MTHYVNTTNHRQMEDGHRFSVGPAVFEVLCKFNRRSVKRLIGATLFDLRNSNMLFRNEHINKVIDEAMLNLRNLLFNESCLWVLLQADLDSTWAETCHVCYKWQEQEQSSLWLRHFILRQSWSAELQRYLITLPLLHITCAKQTKRHLVKWQKCQRFLFWSWLKKIRLWWMR